MTNHHYVNGNFERSYGSWQARGQLPTKPLTKYHLHCPNKEVQTLTLPWIVFAPKSDYNDSASYYAQECAVEAPAPMPSKVRRFHEASTLTENPRSLLGKAGDAHVPHPFNVAFNYTLITSDEMFLFGYFSKGNGVHHKTGIIHIDTFEPENVTLSAQIFHLGLREFKTLGIEKIILDVQNNGGELFKSILCKIIRTADCSFDLIFIHHVGGYICVAQMLLHILFNHINTNSTTPDLEYGTDILVTPQSLVLVALQANNTDCPFSAIDSVPPAPCLPIVSMHEIEHVKTMAVGGILHNLMTYQSFPGLQG
ncbi:hypothetical protein BC938DRAFT_481545 [Jimgerdemannia flammicorona]|uniref:Tail specific protease domain-containing protein n=1 Tax=Jimgerdemannia flammicorona TaxID=994334 RepID=A0A433QFX3_9FUNG|nr:hypothetical protein BC938DRAFT_481545 [Jimgerdemannia flammicorona]